jgi:integrase
MSELVVPGNPRAYELELIRLEHAWLHELAGVNPQERRRAEAVFRASFAASTWKSYNGNWRQWRKWCQERNWPWLPSVPPAVAYYVVWLGGRNKYATIIQKVMAIAVGHRFARVPDPTKHFDVKDCMRGVARIWGVKQTGKSSLLMHDILKLQNLYKEHANPTEACRDLTVVKTGIGAGQRGRQVANFDVEHLDLTPYGFKIYIPRSKTDPYAHGRTIWLPYGLREETCPVKQLLKWLEKSGITSGPLFRAVFSSGRIGDERLSVESISGIVKRCMGLIGRDPKSFGSHSLRVSFVSLAYENGAADEIIKQQTGHKNDDSVRRYIRPPDRPVANTSIIVGM